MTAPPARPEGHLESGCIGGCLGFGSGILALLVFFMILGSIDDLATAIQVALLSAVLAGILAIAVTYFAAARTGGRRLASVIGVLVGLGIFWGFMIGGLFLG